MQRINRVITCKNLHVLKSYPVNYLAALCEQHRQILQIQNFLCACNVNEQGYELHNSVKKNYRKILSTNSQHL